MFGLLNPFLSITAKPVTESTLIFSRTLMKTHKGCAKRWIKTANSWKRGQVGRKHGNAGWTKQQLKPLDGKVYANKTMEKHLKVLMPYH